jgi:hypothetical protein
MMNIGNIQNSTLPKTQGTSSKNNTASLDAPIDLLRKPSQGTGLSLSGTVNFTAFISPSESTEKTNNDKKSTTTTTLVDQIVDNELAKFPKDLKAESASRLLELYNLYSEGISSFVLRSYPKSYQAQLLAKVDERLESLKSTMSAQGIQIPENKKAEEAKKLVKTPIDYFLDKELGEFPADLEALPIQRLGELFSIYGIRAVHSLGIRVTPGAMEKALERLNKVIDEINQRVDIKMGNINEMTPVSYASDQQLEREKKENKSTISTLNQSNLQPMVPFFEDQNEIIEKEMDLRKYGEVGAFGERYMSPESYKRKEADLKGIPYQAEGQEKKPELEDVDQTKDKKQKDDLTVSLNDPVDDKSSKKSIEEENTSNKNDKSETASQKP